MNERKVCFYVPVVRQHSKRLDEKGTERIAKEAADMALATLLRIRQHGALSAVAWSRRRKCFGLPSQRMFRRYANEQAMCSAHMKVTMELSLYPSSGRCFRCLRNTIMGMVKRLLSQNAVFVRFCK